MADFKTAFAWAMTSEDPLLHYAAVKDLPAGSFAISGINSHYFPEDFNKISLIAQAERGPAVEQFYEDHFWNVWFDRLESDEVAKRLFDCGINEGPETAVNLLQRAIEAVSGITGGVDGIWGWNTLERANNCNPDMLAAAFRQARAQAYRDIVKAIPKDAGDLPGWLARAEK